MVNILPKEIGHTKIDYLELLLESPDGITASEISEIFFDDVTKDAAGNALRKLKKQGCAVREKDDTEYRYYLTDRGIMKLDYLKRREIETNVSSFSF